MTSPSQPRLFLIDFLRALALLGMIVYHFVFDTYYFGNSRTLDPYSVPMIALARVVAFFFLLLVGVSFSLSSSAKSDQQVLRHSLRRSIVIFFWAGVVSLVTFFVDPEFMVRFGILHLIATSLILLAFLKQIRGFAFQILFVSLVLAIGSRLPSPPTSFDYFPVFPWFGVVALGFLSAGKTRPLLAREFGPTWFKKTISALSQNSLTLYLLHQPLILSAFWFKSSLFS